MDNIYGGKHGDKLCFVKLDKVRQAGEKAVFCGRMWITFMVEKWMEKNVLCKENIRHLRALYMLLPIFNLFYFALLTLIYLHVMLKSVNYARRIFK